ncbi:hypothetical protein CLOSAC_07950 [Clostridium saccharobutylicum]|uniref:Uncharacterized protein n=1 Tax=Clostridium saccharobutylicum TaxID=169679 RepID=A0A1S8NJ50_CLOSA|nr:hypothetical protein CLOSAC_07950 [Clostridium saccharobutylicum]
MKMTFALSKSHFLRLKRIEKVPKKYGIYVYYNGYKHFVEETERFLFINII